MWDAETGEKVSEYVTKTHNLLSVATFQKKHEMENLFVLEGTNEIKQLSVAVNKKSKNLAIRNEDLFLVDSIKASLEGSFTAFCCDMFGYLILIAESSGKIFVLPFSSTKMPKKRVEFSGHCNPVTRMHFSLDNNYLITCSIDGTIIVWKITANFSFQESVQMSSFNEVLIPKTEFQAISFDQSVKNTDLKQQNEAVSYDLKLKEMSNSEKIKALDYNCKLNLSSMRSLLIELRSDNELKAREFETKLELLLNMFQNDLQVIKDNSESELIKKYNQYEILNKTRKELLQNGLKKRESIANEKEQDMEIENIYKFKIEEINKKHKEELCKMELDIRLNEEENLQIEVEGDDEIEKLRKNYENKSNFYKKDNEQLQLDVCFMRKKLIYEDEKIQNLNSKGEALAEFLKYKQKKLNELEFRIESLKVQVETSTKVLASKDEKSFKIKQKNQRLEKMRFINEHEIVEFQNNINPLKDENKRLIETINENEKKCHETMERIKRFKRLKEKYKSNLQSAKERFYKMKGKLKRLQRLQKHFSNAIISLTEIRDEALIEIEFEKIFKKLPQINNEIAIDKEAILEIDKQLEGLKRVVKRQAKETEKLDVESKETILLNIKENLFFGENLKTTLMKRVYLEKQFKNLKKKIGMKKTNESAVIEMFKKAMNLYKIA